MPDGVLFVGWGPPIPGREKNSNNVFAEGVQFWVEKQKQGEITSFEAFALEPHGGDLWGFALIRGDAGTLAQLRYSPDVQRLNSRAATVVQDFGVVSAIPPDQVQQFYQTYQEDIADLLS
jgi:hypothetical protein